jgi:hypothetical protein
MLTVEDLRREIIKERGGEAAFSVVQLRLTYAVALQLANPREIDPGILSRLLDQLPPVVVRVVAQGGDLTDDELDTLEQLLTRAGVSLDAAGEKLLAASINLQNEHDRAVEQWVIAQRAELMWKRLADDGRVANDHLRAEVERLQAQLAGTTAPIANAHVAPSLRPPEAIPAPSSNVLVGPFAGIVAVNGSCDGSSAGCKSWASACPQGCEAPEQPPRPPARAPEGCLGASPKDPFPSQASPPRRPPRRASKRDPSMIFCVGCLASSSSQCCWGYPYGEFRIGWSKNGLDIAVLDGAAFPFGLFPARKLGGLYPKHNSQLANNL